MPPRLELVDGNLELLTAAVAGGGALGALLGVSVADGWAGFPEALPVLCAAYSEQPGAHAWGSLFFVEPEARALVGLGGFKGPPSPAGVVEIGYAIAPAFRGQGLATDAVTQMLRRAFEDASVRAVDAHTLGRVNPSTRVLEKSGFRRIGELNDPDEGAVWHWRRERTGARPQVEHRIAVRAATSSDAEACVALIVASITTLCVEDHRNDPATLERWLRNKTIGHFGQWLADSANRLFVAEVGSTIAGVALLREGDSLHLCYVAPGMHGLGVGRALLFRVEAEATARGVAELRLKSSGSARGFYERLGYVPDGEVSIAFGVLTEYPYRKKLR